MRSTSIARSPLRFSKSVGWRIVGVRFLMDESGRPRSSWAARRLIGNGRERGWLRRLSRLRALLRHQVRLLVRIEPGEDVEEIAGAHSAQESISVAIDLANVKRRHIW